ncbi:hypothetical protein [Nocardia lijiangensis]|uniref:hypothetical protein n=1 Tax=Nocardia lijiangensis TaxID=299618 RepID=UPI003D745B71
MSDSTQWRRFADQARAGELYLDSEVAVTECLTACDQMIADYQLLLNYAQNAQRVTGFGDFKIADDLAKLFLLQATGDDSSIDAVIRESIEVVKDMREVLQISFKRLTGQDYVNAAQIDSATGELGGQP